MTKLPQQVYAGDERFKDLIAKEAVFAADRKAAALPIMMATSSSSVMSSRSGGVVSGDQPIPMNTFTEFQLSMDSQDLERRKHEQAAAEMRKYFHPPSRHPIQAIADIHGLWHSLTEAEIPCAPLHTTAVAEPHIRTGRVPKRTTMQITPKERLLVPHESSSVTPPLELPGGKQHPLAAGATGEDKHSRSAGTAARRGKEDLEGRTIGTGTCTTRSYESVTRNLPIMPNLSDRMYDDVPGVGPSTDEFDYDPRSTELLLEAKRAGAEYAATATVNGHVSATAAPTATLLLSSAKEALQHEAQQLRGSPLEKGNRRLAAGYVQFMLSVEGRRDWDTTVGMAQRALEECVLEAVKASQQPVSLKQRRSKKKERRSSSAILLQDEDAEGDAEHEDSLIGRTPSPLLDYTQNIIGTKADEARVSLRVEQRNQAAFNTVLTAIRNDLRYCLSGLDESNVVTPPVPNEDTVERVADEEGVRPSYAMPLRPKRVFPWQVSHRRKKVPGLHGDAFITTASVGAGGGGGGGGQQQQEELEDEANKKQQQRRISETTTHSVSTPATEDMPATPTTPAGTAATARKQASQTRILGKRSSSGNTGPQLGVGVGVGRKGKAPQPPATARPHTVSNMSSVMSAGYSRKQSVGSTENASIPAGSSGENAATTGTPTVAMAASATTAGSLAPTGQGSMTSRYPNYLHAHHKSKLEDDTLSPQHVANELAQLRTAADQDKDPRRHRHRQTSPTRGGEEGDAADGTGTVSSRQNTPARQRKLGRGKGKSPPRKHSLSDTAAGNNNKGKQQPQPSPNDEKEGGGNGATTVVTVASPHLYIPGSPVTGTPSTASFGPALDDDGKPMLFFPFPPTKAALVSALGKARESKHAHALQLDVAAAVDACTKVHGGGEEKKPTPISAKDPVVAKFLAAKAKTVPPCGDRWYEMGRRGTPRVSPRDLYQGSFNLKGLSPYLAMELGRVRPPVPNPDVDDTTEAPSARTEGVIDNRSFDVDCRPKTELIQWMY